MKKVPLLSALGLGKSKQQKIRDLFLKAEELENTLLNETIVTETTHGKKKPDERKMTTAEIAKVQEKQEVVFSELRKMFAKYPQAFAEVMGELLVTSDHMKFLNSGKNVLDINIWVQIIILSEKHNSPFFAVPEALTNFAELMPIVFNPAFKSQTISTEQLKQDMKIALQKSMQAFAITQELKRVATRQKNATTKKQKAAARLAEISTSPLEDFVTAHQLTRTQQVARLPHKYNEYVDAIDALKTAGSVEERISVMQNIVRIEKQMLEICRTALKWLTESKGETKFEADIVQIAFTTLISKLDEFEQSLSEPFSVTLLNDLKALKESIDAERSTSHHTPRKRG